jgi:NTP pyrophosphatase (non-canonical NTP hydrolase)
MSRFEKLNGRVGTWAKSKGILDKATPLSQHSKTQEEVNELFEALFAQKNNLPLFTDSKGSLKDTSGEIEDAIGDILVTVLIQCNIQHLNPLECLESALDIIEKRTGKMINGTFVKDK